jgi:hypothetical protein
MGASNDGTAARRSTGSGIVRIVIGNAVVPGDCRALTSLSFVATLPPMTLPSQIENTKTSLSDLLAARADILTADRPATRRNW